MRERGGRTGRKERKSGTGAGGGGQLTFTVSKTHQVPSTQQNFLLAHFYFY